LERLAQKVLAMGQRTAPVVARAEAESPNHAVVELETERADEMTTLRIFRPMVEKGDATYPLAFLAKSLGVKSTTLSGKYIKRSLTGTGLTLPEETAGQLTYRGLTVPVRRDPQTKRWFISRANAAMIVRETAAF
jgi:hypothetical protein